MTTPLSSLPGDDSQGLNFDLEAMPGWRIRDSVRDLLAPDTGVVVEDAVLVVEEMVANAREHGSPPRGCRISLRSGPARLRVEVDDSGNGDPHIRTPDLTGGRGMLVIDRLATAWGVVRREGFKTVWAELPLDRPHRPPMAAAPAPDRDDTRRDS